MDPLDAPLEPPHHVTDFSQTPFVIRANAPVASGVEWIGFAHVVKYENRAEIIGWTNLDESWPPDTTPALAVILPEPLPMEFPKRGEEFFRELAKRDIDRDAVLRYLAFAAYLTSPGEEIHLVLGIPMRRSANGEPRASRRCMDDVAKFCEHLAADPSETRCPPTLAECLAELAELIYSAIATDEIAFCRVFDDRPEIVVARDQASRGVVFGQTDSVAWLRGIRVMDRRRSPLVQAQQRFTSWIAAS